MKHETLITPVSCVNILMSDITIINYFFIAFPRPRSTHAPTHIPPPINYELRITKANDHRKHKHHAQTSRTNITHKHQAQTSGTITTHNHHAQTSRASAVIRNS
ncbi:MAG: hypothetical protein LBQ31_03880 [Bacteroidales bacterium]|nr:hypothetical protein [Bacteroidales bacterium]